MMKRTERIYLSPPHMGGEEIRFVEEAFKSNFIAPLGPQVDAFEREFADKIGMPYAVALSSGTAAMHLVMRMLGVGKGSVVLAPSLNFIGSVSPVTYEGGTLVFIDSDRSSWNIDPELLEEEIKDSTKKGILPKAVIVTDIFGQCTDLDRIIDICATYEIPVISDSAESLGATYKGRGAGVGAKAAIYSFNGNKIITTSGGGMLVSQDKELIDKARFLATQARDAAPHYEHSQIGFNYRMSNIVAAIGRGQLKVLDQRVDQKRYIFDKYLGLLGDVPGIDFMPEASYGRSNRWLTVILINPEKSGTDRETVRKELEKHNIESRPVWKPMHMQPVFSKCSMRGGQVAEHLFTNGLCLPSGTAMTDEDIEKISSYIRGQVSSIV